MGTLLRLTCNQVSLSARVPTNYSDFKNRGRGLVPNPVSVVGMAGIQGE